MKKDIGNFNFDVVLIDDIYKTGIPLVRLNLNFNDLLMQNTHTSNIIQTSIIIQMAYYNYRVKFWEPVLENWVIDLRKSLDLQTEEDKTKVSLRNIFPCLNVSTEFIRLIKKIQENVVSQSECLIKKVKFFVRNNTGNDIEFKIIYADDQRSNKVYSIPKENVVSIQE